MTTQGRDSHSQGGAANSWRSWVPVISKEENMEGRKDKCSSCFTHVFNNMFFNSHLFFREYLEDSQCNDMFVVGYSPLFLV